MSNFWIDKEGDTTTKGWMTIATIFVILGLLINFLVDRQKCMSAYSNYQPSYGVFSGCRILWNGKLTPPDIIYSSKP